ncbi:MAG: DUF1858 domain-containing protein [Anaerolineales bacterium]|nr:DUF1858 domain-containing protein [Anaerolineales bacterium]
MQITITKVNVDINPSTTVCELLDAYPELEDKLISMASPFKKLKNPLLRKSISKVETMKHISSVGGIQLNELINILRNEVGQSVMDETYEDTIYFLPEPEWFSTEKISVSVVEEEVEDKHNMTVVAVLREAKKVNTGEIIELVTTFLPAPGIDIMRSKGYSVWTKKDEGDIIRIYFLKNHDG